MKNLILSILLLVPVLTSAKSPLDKDESKAVMDFVDAVNSNRSSCPGGSSPFTDLGQLQYDYLMTYNLDTDLGTCVKGEVPKKYRCLIKGEALKKLHELAKSPVFQSEVEKHVTKHSLNADMPTDFPGFIKEIDSKFSEE